MICASYTFSKSIDDTSAFLPTTADQNFPQDSHNYRLERALSSFDEPNRATRRAALSHSRRIALDARIRSQQHYHGAVRPAVYAGALNRQQQHRQHRRELRDRSAQRSVQSLSSRIRRRRNGSTPRLSRFRRSTPGADAGRNILRGPGLGHRRFFVAAPLYAARRDEH